MLLESILAIYIFIEKHPFIFSNLLPQNLHKSFILNNILTVYGFIPVFAVCVMYLCLFLLFID